jgi:hypothetical protein
MPTLQALELRWPHPGSRMMLLARVGSPLPVYGASFGSSGAGWSLAAKSYSSNSRMMGCVAL